MMQPPELPVGRVVERFIELLTRHGQGVFDAITWLVSALHGAFVTLVGEPPASLWVVALVAIGMWRYSRNFAAGTALSLAAVVAMGLWPELADTLALVLTATLISLTVGLPLGVWAAKSQPVERALRPLLDLMQTMPAFVYLIPAVMFFGLGRVPGVIATVIFATPPAVRLTSLGLRQVPRERVEAGLAFGCNRFQLLFRVEIPSALPSILAGINQNTMLALSMVVIASMIGAGGLGDGVLRGIQRLDVGVGFESGLAVVLLAIVLDRITQSFATRPESSAAGHEADAPRSLVKQGASLLLVLAGLSAIGYVGWHDAAAQGLLGPEAPTAGSELEPSAEGPTSRSDAPVDAEVDPEAGCGTLRIGWTAWADAELVTQLTARLLREHFGCQVKLVMTDVGVQYRSLSTGELDLMLMAWLPQTHASYWDQVSDSVLDLGPLYTGARLGWAVPATVPKDQLNSIEDLQKPAIRRRLKGRIQGIDPGSGLMQASARALEAYGLYNDYRLVSGSGAAMTAAVERAVRLDQWVVVTTWNPHWMFTRWDLRYLEDPRRVLSQGEQVHALARRTFSRDYPTSVQDFLTRLYLPLDELEAAMADAVDTDTEAAVDRYLQAHPDRVRYWLHGEL